MTESKPFDRDKALAWYVRAQKHIDRGTEPDDCHLWTGARDAGGYGVARDWDGRVRRTHILVYEVFSGAPVPEGEVVDHKCRVRACCRFDHTQSETSRTNTLLGMGPTAMNAKKTHCPNNHEYTEENTLWHSGRRECRKCVNQRRKEQRRAAREQAEE